VAQSSNLGKGKKVFILQIAKIGSEVNATSYVMGAKFLSRGLNQRGPGADHSPLSSAVDKNEWIYTYISPIRLHGADREKVTFLYETAKLR
jgi:hypothetical protein